MNKKTQIRARIPLLPRLPVPAHIYQPTHTHTHQMYTSRLLFVDFEVRQVFFCRAYNAALYFIHLEHEIVPHKTVQDLQNKKRKKIWHDAREKKPQKIYVMFWCVHACVRVHARIFANRTLFIYVFSCYVFGFRSRNVHFFSVFHETFLRFSLLLLAFSTYSGVAKQYTRIFVIPNVFYLFRPVIAFGPPVIGTYILSQVRRNEKKPYFVYVFSARSADNWETDSVQNEVATKKANVSFSCN